MITKLTLKNFKSFEEAEIKMGAVTTLIGTNASGKSNVRDALRILHGIGRGYSLAEAIGEKWGEGGDLQWKGIRGGTREMIYQDSKQRICEIAVEFDIDCTDLFSDSAWQNALFHVGAESLRGTYSIAIELEGNQTLKPKVHSESLMINDSMVYRTDDLLKPMPSGKASKINTILETDDAILTKQYWNTISILEQIHNDNDGDQEIINIHFTVMMVRRFLSRMRFLDVSPEAMRQPSTPGQTILTDQGENLSSVLATICEDERRKDVLLDWLREIPQQDVTDLVFTEDQRGKILVGLVDSVGRSISAYSASDGTLRFLAMLAALLSPHPAKFYFFEEVENGIHPSRLHLLVQLMEQRSMVVGNQLMFSTHSPQLLGYLGEKSRNLASLVYRQTFGSSYIKPVMKIGNIDQLLQKQSVADLHASGWFENVMDFLDDEEEETEA